MSWSRSERAFRWWSRWRGSSTSTRAASRRPPESRCGPASRWCSSGSDCWRRRQASSTTWSCAARLARPRQAPALPSQCCRSSTSARTRNRNTSPTGSRRSCSTFSPRCRGCASRRALLHSPSRARTKTSAPSPRSCTWPPSSKAACARRAIRSASPPSSSTPRAATTSGRRPTTASSPTCSPCRTRSRRQWWRHSSSSY